MEEEYEKVPKNEEDLCKMVLKSKENLIKIVPKSVEYVIEIVLKREEELSEIVLKNEKDLSEVDIKYEEWETVTVCIEEQSESVLRDEKDLYDSTLPKGLEVKPLNFPGGAMGVFTLVGLEKDFHFVSYFGERIELHESELAFKSKRCWLVNNS